jgi:hypothetical protein
VKFGASAASSVVVVSSTKITRQDPGACRRDGRRASCDAGWH